MLKQVRYLRRVNIGNFQHFEVEVVMEMPMDSDGNATMLPSELIDDAYQLVELRCGIMRQDIRDALADRGVQSSKKQDDMPF